MSAICCGFFLDLIWRFQSEWNIKRVVPVCCKSRKQHNYGRTNEGDSPTPYVANILPIKWVFFFRFLSHTYLIFEEQI